MMSHVEGSDQLIGKLDVFADTMGKLCFELYDREMIAAQEEAVSLIPVDTGKARDALASEAALKKDTDGRSGETTWSFGMITIAIQKAAYYLFWIEFGTKGSAKGELLYPGVVDKRSRSGRLRKARRRKRGRPAMPARPWFRPAQINLFRRLEKLQDLDRLVRSAMKAARLADAE
ncbi:hypothetical protein [Hyphomicrobium sp. LHD-15]|uniref:hypothetical protein n=1 Tax=Hyphomicrobium sp. LHD-15 TaxID=3072142 RepID=UPI00280E51F3|nr:hypothetical protein [Hyphomicrobium sp. LHD-15]MDQ8700590.1 hypothetical protein [Hyphomicrobium sp. LHD-15]